MRFFHLGDLHLGKSFHNISLIEQDQPFFIDRFLEAVDRCQPEAVVIAGDVYDRKIPSPEAMQLFDHLLTELAKRDIYVFVIPGNHDSAARLSHVRELLTSHRIYIAGDVSRELQHITLQDEKGAVCFWLMPYIFPRAVADPRVLNREELSGYDEAVRALLAEQPLDPSIANILAAHQNVVSGDTAPEHSGSETIIGGLGEIEADAFDAFDYVALGHIHNAQKIGRETIRYSGCPLYYDFSELNRRKPLTLVTVEGKTVRVEEIPLELPHTLAEKRGTLAELVREGLSMPDKDRVYVQCVLTDAVTPPRALEQLKEAFGPCLVHVKREPACLMPEEGAVLRGSAEAAALSMTEQFELFYSTLTKTELNENQFQLLEQILEQQSRRGEAYYTDSKQVPEQESDELLTLLMSLTEEQT